MDDFPSSQFLETSQKAKSFSEFSLCWLLSQLLFQRKGFENTFVKKTVFKASVKVHPLWGVPQLALFFYFVISFPKIVWRNYGESLDNNNHHLMIFGQNFQIVAPLKRV
jgi:hypothetical protein